MEKTTDTVAMPKLCKMASSPMKSQSVLIVFEVDVDGIGFDVVGSSGGFDIVTSGQC